jgi:hypothetical protein
MVSLHIQYIVYAVTLVKTTVIHNIVGIISDIAKIMYLPCADYVTKLAVHYTRPTPSSTS